jgi:hypothetical protein
MSTPHDAHGHPHLPNVESHHQYNSASPQQMLQSNEHVGLQHATPSYNGTSASPISQSNSLVKDPNCAPRYSPRIDHQTGHNHIACNSRDALSTCTQFPSEYANAATKSGKLLNSLSQEPSRSPASRGVCYNQQPNSTQRGKRQRIDHISSSPRHESDTARSRAVPDEPHRNLESTPVRSDGQHTEGSSGRVCQGPSFQMNAAQQLPHTHMKGIEINREVRDYEQKTQEGESKDHMKLRTTEGLSNGDNSLQQRILMFRPPAETKKSFSMRGKILNRPCVQQRVRRNI